MAYDSIARNLQQAPPLVVPEDSAPRNHDLPGPVQGAVPSDSISIDVGGGVMVDVRLDVGLMIEVRPISLGVDHGIVRDYNRMLERRATEMRQQIKELFTETLQNRNRDTTQIEQFTYNHHRHILTLPVHINEIGRIVDMDPTAILDLLPPRFTNVPEGIEFRNIRFDAGETRRILEYIEDVHHQTATDEMAALVRTRGSDNLIQGMNQEATQEAVAQVVEATRRGVTVNPLFAQEYLVTPEEATESDNPSVAIEPFDLVP